jgi:hypothetical protein
MAVEWRGSEAADETLRLAVREALAGVDGRWPEAVPDQALERARVAVSRELPATTRELRADLRRSIDEADAAYREGRFTEVRGLIDETLASLRANPQLPGAAASARELHLLAARLAWAAGDAAIAEQALLEALRLDPEAALAARRAPPELVERYQALQAELEARRESDWVSPRLIVDGRVLGADAEVEIDGLPGLRPVPPGPHFVLVFRDGHEPVAAWRELDSPWTVPAAAERITTDLDVEHENICRALALDRLILAERRGPVVGLQGYECGVGFGPLWSGNREGLQTGAALVLAGPFDAERSSLAGSWTRAGEPVSAPVDEAIDERRPWHRRGWIWGTAAGATAVIVGGVVAGVLLGGRERPRPSLDIDADTFLLGR